MDGAYTRYTRTSSKKYLRNSQTFIGKPKTDGVFCLKGNYIDLDFKVSYKDVAHGEYEDAALIRLVTLAPLALFQEHKMSTSTQKHLKHIDDAHNKS